ncbi:synaptobrevin-1-like isoform X2 [Artemia franciscana]|uniref:synaptobrevin-1-like isoform X2 n=1 Tax=Artemia franciscana TaxID=6661 RepID=UPI0032DA15DB
MSSPTGLAPEGAAGGDAPIVGGPRTPQQIAAQRRLQQTQAQVDEVVGIMRVNVEKVLERDEKLSELDDRADALQQGASQFEQQAAKMKNKFWWKNMKLLPPLEVIPHEFSPTLPIIPFLFEALPRRMDIYMCIYRYKINMLWTSVSFFSL